MRKAENNVFYFKVFFFQFGCFITRVEKIKQNKTRRDMHGAKQKIDTNVAILYVVI